MRNPFYSTRGLSLAATLGLLHQLPQAHINNCFIVLGQAHFASTYLYKYAYGKSRITRPGMLGYALTVTALFLSLRFFNWERLLAFVTGAYFFWHFVRDEITLGGERPDWTRVLEGAPLLALYTGIHADNQLGAKLAAPCAAAALSAVFLRILLALRGSGGLDRLSYYLLLLFAGSLIFYWTTPSSAYFFPFVIIFHYFNWYLGYYGKLDPSDRKPYLLNIAVVNSVLLGLFAVYVSSSRYSRQLSVLFLPTAFYIWTIMHLATTTGTGLLPISSGTTRTRPSD